MKVRFIFPKDFNNGQVINFHVILSNFPKPVFVICLSFPFVIFFPLLKMKVDEVDEQLLTQLAYNARGDLCPMQGVIGGITAQEVMKVNVSLVYLSNP